MSFDQALAFTLPSEGGYVNDPNDSGGATNRGITQHTFDAYRDSLKQPRQGVKLITDAEVARIYHEMYWTPAHCEQMPDALGVCVFDTAVNCGVNSAIKMLQRAVGVEDDGVYGPHTAEEVSHEGNELVIPFLDERRARYRQIVTAKPSQEVFLKGWLNRCNALEDYAQGLI